MARRATSATSSCGSEVSAGDLEDLEIELLVEAVYRRYGYDFRNYARATLRRRVLYMVQAERLSSVSALQERVLRDAAALERLTWHIAVNATSMFRDPGCFAALRRTLVPVLAALPFFRVWHAGCATGEEVYSLAILLTEEGLYDRARIYATDMSAAAVERARAGIYPLSLMKEFTENYLRAGGTMPFSSYYAARYDSAIFRRELQRNVLFAQHNLVVDRSFNEFQVILCRNVLIYFDAALQGRVHGLLRDSLASDGFLVLGRAEALPAGVRDGYAEVDGRERIFRRVAVPAQRRASLDPDARDREQHLAEEHDERDHEGDHRGDEQRRDDERRVHREHRADERDRDEHAHEQRRHDARGDGHVHEVTARGEHVQLAADPLHVGGLNLRQSIAQYPGAVHDAPEARREDAQDRADGRQQEHGCDRELDHVGDVGERGLVHESPAAFGRR